MQAGVDYVEHISPSAAVGRRIAEIQAEQRLSDAGLAARLTAIGFATVGRNGIRDIKNGKRRLTLDETLALAWVLEIAPVHLIVPFEDSEPVTHDQDGEPIEPFYGPVTGIRIGDGVEMDPIPARSWIQGRAIPGGESDNRLWRRFRVELVPPQDRARREAEMKAAAEKQADRDERFVELVASDPENLEAAIQMYNRRALAEALKRSERSKEEES